MSMDVVGDRFQTMEYHYKQDKLEHQQVAEAVNHNAALLEQNDALCQQIVALLGIVFE